MSRNKEHHGKGFSRQRDRGNAQKPGGRKKDNGLENGIIGEVAWTHIPLKNLGQRTVTRGGILEGAVTSLGPEGSAEVKRTRITGSIVTGKARSSDN